MIILKQITNMRPVLVTGQTFLILGIVGVSHAGLFSGEMPRTFANGLLLGVSLVVLIFSAPLNIAAIRRLRLEKRGSNRGESGTMLKSASDQRQAHRYSFIIFWALTSTAGENASLFI